MELPFDSDDLPFDLEPAPRQAPTHCPHGVAYDGDEDCRACYEDHQALEDGLTWKDFPDDRDFYDEEGQRDLALHEATWPLAAGPREEPARVYGGAWDLFAAVAASQDAGPRDADFAGNAF